MSKKANEKERKDKETGRITENNRKKFWEL